MPNLILVVEMGRMYQSTVYLVLKNYGWLSIIVSKRE